MATISASDARKRFYNLVDEVKESHVPVQIVGQRSSAVFVSEEDWRAIEETLLSRVNTWNAGVHKERA